MQDDLEITSNYYFSNFLDKLLSIYTWIYIWFVARQFHADEKVNLKIYLSPEACKLPQSKGPCLSYNVRWYYDSERESCSNFAYGGCLGNSNNFATSELCQKQCEPEKSTGK